MRTCSRCGGPLRSNSKSGICRRNPDCLKAGLREKNRQRSREYQRNLPHEVRQANNLRTAHGLTPAEKQQMLDAQGGRCYLCGDALTYDAAVIDHDHACCADVTKSGRKRTTSCARCRRGLACGRCNTLIGMAGDDPEKLRRIAGSLTRVIAEVHARLAAKPEQLELEAVQ